ncbi:hypothetical protein OPV22_025541 [Ensete ventricosum]|uniref:Uncharacterized protein n=1 Tax=Ensete ventricosum TaxID=4639 RepID=A0AAV8QE33_ENSVE|nr:hypothetical protein OPV22_025541 [Ensete ventricosum]
MHHRDVDAPMASRCPGRRRQQLLRRTTELPPSCHPISCPALQGPPHVAISAYLARVIPGRFVPCSIRSCKPQVPLGYADMQVRQPHLLPPLVHWPWSNKKDPPSVAR